MEVESVEGPSSLRDFSETLIRISDESKKWMTERAPDYSRYQNMLIRRRSYLAFAKRNQAVRIARFEDRRATEIRFFLVIVYLGGYNNMPSKRHYWDSNNDIKKFAVTQSMCRHISTY